MQIGTFIVRRLLLLIPVLIGVSLLTFFIIRLAGDPVFTYLPAHPTPAQIIAVRHQYHLDEPIYIQYFYWANGVVHGDLGWSRTASTSVYHAIVQKFPATFELALISTAIAVLIGISVGTRAAIKANSVEDQGARVVSLVGVSIPVFWLGLMLLMVFYAMLHLAPAPSGQYSLQYDPFTLKFHSHFLLFDTLASGDIPFFLDVVGHLVLPSITLAFASTAIIIRMMRSSMLEVLGAEYVRTARSKGLPEKVVIRKHARRNALIPTTTVIGLSFGGLLGGAVLTETVFTWNGLGQWAAESASNIDTASIMGFTLLTATIYVLANLTVDIVYAFLDPRVRLD